MRDMGKLYIANDIRIQTIDTVYFLKQTIDRLCDIQSRETESNAFHFEEQSPSICL